MPIDAAEDGVVFEDTSVGPKTHVLIVGVGRYPFLRDGGDSADAASLLAQLQSPSRSARLMADWYIKHYNYPRAPLGTVSLLVSDSEPSPYLASDQWNLREPTYDAFAAAVNHWFDRGNRSEDERLIFYFCGHGFGYGGESSLLMADFDFRRRNKWDNALDFGQFYQGLETCAASEQIFFIDACRRPHGDLLAPEAAIGRSPIQPSAQGRNSFVSRNAPITFSAGNAQLAHGRIDGASIFTDAFLRSVDGMAANEDNGDWRVNHASLLYALSHVSDRLTKAGFPEPQQPQGVVSSFLDFHFLRHPPVSPVYISRLDEVSCGPGQLIVKTDERSHALTCEPDQYEIELSLPFGAYSFNLNHSDGQTFIAAQDSRPTFKTVRLK